MDEARRHLPEGYSIRLMTEEDYAEIAEICRRVYPTERPYTLEELAAHHRVFPVSATVQKWKRETEQKWNE
ncbi:MAG: hypothetical protein ACOYOL_06565, partial [Chthoniobacterales bacterium]